MPGILQPEFWPTGLGGYDEKGQWQSGFEPFAAYFHRVATALNPCSDGKPILSGPGWGEHQAVSSSHKLMKHHARSIPVSVPPTTTATARHDR